MRVIFESSTGAHGLARDGGELDDHVAQGSAEHRDEGRSVPVITEVQTSPGPRNQEFAAFAATAQTALLQTAWLLTGDEHQATELVQDALVRTYAAWPAARASDPMAYARRVLANARIDHWRRRRREVLRSPEGMPDVHGPGHADVVVQRDELARGLALLSRGQRRVVVLRYMVGLSEAEVAADLGVSAGTVKTQASRGLRRLRKALGDSPLERGEVDG